MRSTGEDAKGKWPGILEALGVDTRLLRGNHSPCPICKTGKDRFRFDDREQKGGWICNSCGAGDGFKLLMLIKGIEFKECAELVRGVMGQVEIVTTRRKVKHMDNSLLRKMWVDSVPVAPDNMAGRYLEARGILSASKALRFLEQCRNSKGQYYPALLAIVSEPDGKPLTMHRTYLVGSQKAAIESPRELMPGKLVDGTCVRLGEESEQMGIAEGIETALSASLLFNMPVWAALNAGMMEKWQPPTCVKQLNIFSDNDANYRGQRAAYTLANRLHTSELGVCVLTPLGVGHDWNDELMSRFKTKAA